MTTATVQRAPPLRPASRAGAQWDPGPMTAAAHATADEALHECAAQPNGLTSAEAAKRLLTAGPNEVASAHPPGWPRRLLRTFRNPLVALLAVLAAISLATGDVRSTVVITLMIVLGVALRFVQEARADTAAAALRAMIRVTAAVLRDGVETEIALRDVVPGDLVILNAGDVIPGDVRILVSKDLYVNQASLTGESLPAEKHATLASDAGDDPLAAANLAFLGTSVQSGTARAVVVRTGAATLFGSMVRDVATEPQETAFDRGISRFTWLMVRMVAVMVPLVFVINGVTKHDWREAFFFALAVAVGLTPEMLPMIVSVCLSKGAVAMSRKKAIVKRLDAIQNFGAMDVLCADKTGTLTWDSVILERYCDAEGRQSDRVLLDALLISHLQTGLRSALDDAVLQHLPKDPELRVEQYRKVDEIPFDFSRRIMSVVVESPAGARRLLAKGAPEEIIRRCTGFEVEGAPFACEPAFFDALREEYDALSAQGFRVLAVASRDVAVQATYAKDDECELVLVGYVAFLDPPKETAGPAIAALAQAGIRVKILTGDNELVTRTICKHVGIDTSDDASVVLGADLASIDDAALHGVVERATVFARLSPADKERIIHALQAQGHVVGYLGDGINDAPALRAADVGISVDSGVDVAKESADIILLEKNLLVLHDGVLEGRKVFSNIVKYVRMGASSNFGNMFSVLGASALLPFVPMAPIQVLTNNLLYDFSQIPIPTDNVDPEQIARPRPWDIGEIERYILLIGPLSSIFDYTTFAIMWWVFHANTLARASLFQTGWFVESLMTQTLIIHVIRTNHLPFVHGRPSWPLLATTVTVMTAGALLPYSPLAESLGFVALPPLYWLLLLLTLGCYLTLTQLVKTLLVRRHWI